MNIKKTNFKLAALAILTAGAALSACNDIEPGDRYKELPPIDAKRGVLLEEFTGQMCSNCPLAHDIIKELKSQYGEQLIVVGIHSGGDAFSIAEGDPFWTSMNVAGLRQPEGETYLNNAGFKSGMGLPIGNVNRMTGLLGRNDWSKKIYDIIGLEPKVDINLSAEIVEGADGKGKEISIKTILRPTEKFKANLQLWVLESGIKSVQLNPDGSMPMDYVHDHVYRAHINGINGEQTEFDPDLLTEKLHSIKVRDNWNADNLSIVAFVYDGGGVLQAVETDVLSAPVGAES